MRKCPVHNCPAKTGAKIAASTTMPTRMTPSRPLGFLTTFNRKPPMPRRAERMRKPIFFIISYTSFTRGSNL